MNNPEISVIVPVYNAERFLSSCIDSIICQSFSNWELIIADDGSSDSSGMIADDYAQIDSRIKVIHLERLGVSVARNICIDNSVGLFWAFVDADDVLEPTYLEELYFQAGHSNADITQCSFCFMDEDDRKVSEPVGINAIYSDSKSIMNAYFHGQQGDITTSVWAKLFRSEVFCDIRFDPMLRVYEDAYFVFQCCLRARKVFCFDSPLYYYVQNKASTTHARISEIWCDYYTLYQRQREEFKDELLIIKKIERREAETGLWLMRIMTQEGNESVLRDIRRELLGIFRSILWSSSPFLIKLKIVTVAIAPHIYFWLLKCGNC